MKINKAQSAIKQLVVKVSREDDNDRSRILYPYRYRYRGIAYIKGLRRVRLTEVVSASCVFDGAIGCMLEFDSNGRWENYKSRKDCRDLIRKLRQGTREKVIHQAELNLKRLLASLQR